MTEAPDHPMFYLRADLGADPPTAAFARAVERRIAERGVAHFADDRYDPALLFDLRLHEGAYRVYDIGRRLPGAYASAEAAIRAGWAWIDAWSAVSARPTPPR